MHISKDPDVNAGYISFSRDRLRDGSVATSLPVYDNEEVTAVLDFNNKGELVGLELLNASRQMAHLEPS